MIHLVIAKHTDREGSTYALTHEAKKLLPDDVKPFSPRIFVAHPQPYPQIGSINDHQEKALICLLLGTTDVSRFTWSFEK